MLVISVKKRKMWNVGYYTLPLNENTVWHRRSCYILTQE